MEERLKYIFNNTNDWLKFAEAKNGILLAALGASLFSIIDKSKDVLFSNNVSIVNNIPIIKFDINFFISLYLVFLMIFLVMAICVVLISYLPQTKQIFKVKDGKNANDNSLFYGDILKYNAIEYLQFIEPLKADFSKSELDYANQIIMNSHIAYRKYKYFELALFLILSGIVTLPGLFLIRKYLNPNK